MLSIFTYISNSLGKSIIQRKIISACDSQLIVSDSFQPYGLQPARLLHSWNSPSKNTGVGCHSLLQGIFLARGLNPGLPYCRQILYHMNHQGSPSVPITNSTNSSAFYTMPYSRVQHQLGTFCIQVPMFKVQFRNFLAMTLGKLHSQLFAAGSSSDDDNSKV